MASSSPIKTSALPGEREPAWEVALLFPDQGEWTEIDYLLATESTNQLVELSNGHLEILPMPATTHQLLVQYLSNLLLAFVSPGNLGRVLFAPLRVRIASRTFREPDIIFMLSEHADRMGDDYWQGADLVMEVVSEEHRERDLVTKRADYAAAGIPEYWIVDPQEQTITVLHLAEREYAEDGPFRAGQQAASRLLRGFSVNVDSVFAAASGSR